MRPTRFAPAALLAVLALTGCGGSEPTAENARAECENHISRDAEPPGSVEFGASSEVTVVDDDDEDLWQYEVAGSVESGDFYDSEVPTDYTCLVINNGGDWAVVDLRSGEE
ncbi:hypothetical protein ABZ249_11120 [Nocardiopsis sp. NPDC006139]|uniref:hypothetical protein n=1 Tax=Nocardiopsis TaxID=2013 RepID=UPI0033BCA923